MLLGLEQKTSITTKMIFLSKPLSNKLWQIVPRNFPYCKILLGNT